MNTSDHIYVDLNAFNSSTNNQNQTLLLSERRNGAFLFDASQYYMTVARFYLENPRFPVIIPVVDLSQTSSVNANKLVYKIYMEYWNGTQISIAEQALLFVPDDKTQPIPTNISVKDLTFNKYYWLYSYESFVEIMNTALKSCYGLTGKSVTSDTTLQPDISIAISNFSTHEFVCTARNDFFNDIDPNSNVSSSNNKVRVYFNAPLMALFAGFRSIKTSITLDGAVVDANRLRLFNWGDNYTKPSTGDGRAFISILTDIPSTNTWNPIQSIVFTSGVIPVSQNLIGANQVFNAPKGFENSGSNSNVSPIITDLQLPFEPSNTYRPFIYYTPSSAYRLIDMVSNNNLTDLSVEVFWRDRYGSLHAFELLPFCSVSLKLLFRHKSLGV
jgi:hypothetical protein